MRLKLGRKRFGEHPLESSSSGANMGMVGWRVIGGPGIPEPDKVATKLWKRSPMSTMCHFVEKVGTVYL